MFHPISIPFGAKMLFNIVKLKEGISIEDVELTLGTMCNVVKNKYGDEKGGFIAGQVFEYSGFISDEGSVQPIDNIKDDIGDHVAIITYWKSFEQHEASHADADFKEQFAALAELCEETYELGYNMLWQGVPE